MKKFAIAVGVLSLIVVVGLLLKRQDVQTPEETISTEAKSAINQAEQALGNVENQNEVVTQKDEAQVPAEIPTEEEGMLLTEEQMLKLEAHFEKVEKDWSDRMNQLFNKDLGLDPKVLQEYYKMREGYEQDKLDAFEDFHEEMIEKYGENYSYRPSEEE